MDSTAHIAEFDGSSKLLIRRQKQSTKSSGGMGPIPGNEHDLRSRTCELEGNCSFTIESRFLAPSCSVGVIVFCVLFHTFMSLQTVVVSIRAFVSPSLFSPIAGPALASLSFIDLFFSQKVVHK